MGNIKVKLFKKKAPKTVANFLKYIDEKHYENTVFHRVINGFMIQAGGLDTNFNPKPTREPFENEAANKLSNKIGTIAMARTFEPHSATCEFFINAADNGFLDYKAPSPQNYGYCVFGKVTEGMDVVAEINKVQTGFKGVLADVPEEDIIISEIVRC
jgi:peptidyl-prolyl cis-trans isomerase B (cyclophilin B)